MHSSPSERIRRRQRLRDISAVRRCLPCLSPIVAHPASCSSTCEPTPRCAVLGGALDHGVLGSRARNASYAGSCKAGGRRRTLLLSGGIAVHLGGTPDSGSADRTSYARTN